MKNKGMTYLLGFLLIVVWGLIIYRVVAAVGANDDEDLPVVSAKAPDKNFNDYSIKKDTTHLLLNYSDPFGIVAPPDTAKSRRPIPKPLNTVAKPILQPFNWSFIKYAGYIRNPGTKKLIAIVRINDKNVMLAEGESAERVKLVKNMIDSIKVSFNGKSKFITMHPPL